MDVLIHGEKSFTMGTYIKSCLNILQFYQIYPNKAEQKKVMKKILLMKNF